MRYRAVHVPLLCLTLAFAALAMPAFADERVSGFTTNATGELKGKVTDEDGDPISDLPVYITAPGGERMVKTDENGQYKIDLGSTPGEKFVFVRTTARINGQALETEMLDSGEEVFQIQESEKPAVMPRPKSPTNKIPGYSEEAREADVWVRAWILLEIDQAGNVRRMKMLKSPGYGLDDIAIRHAGNLRFEPARGASGKPVSAMVVWPYEWPSYSWMLERKAPPKVVPAEAQWVSCATTEVPHSRLRDCSKADITKAHGLPWIDAMQLPSRLAFDEEERKSQLPGEWYEDTLGWVLTGGGVAMLATGLYLHLSASSLEDGLDSERNETRRAQIQDRADARRFAGYLLGGAGIAAVGVGAATLVIHSDGKSSGAVALVGRF
jgi:hypothetical protein